MSVVAHEVRPGAYADSIVLMQLQSALAARPGISEAGVVMATRANLELLAASDLLPSPLPEVAGDDLLIVVRAETPDVAAEALAAVDRLMARTTSAAPSGFRPRTLASAWTLVPAARWALVSVPGRYAARVAEEVLDAGRNVFLYSDNVALADEVRLKRQAAGRGLLVMGPDCGTAIVAGVGFGFANRVRRGPIGIVAAAGTGLQAVACGLEARGSGVSHALGTGGRDLSGEVGGATALAALDLLARDDETEVLVLVSKPPAPEVAARVLAAARGCGKPVIVAFGGLAPAASRVGNLEFARSLDEAVELAARRAAAPLSEESGSPSTGLLRGLFSGGTLAQEVLRSVALLLDPVASNLKAEVAIDLGAPEAAGAHHVVDLGADEFTLGRPHPMVDQSLRLERLRREAADQRVALVLLDVVLGDGAHPDPAGELAPVIREALDRDGLEVVALVVGTADDPQGLGRQIEVLEEAGAYVVGRVEDAVARVAARLGRLPVGLPSAVALDALARPAVVNVGLEMFASSLAARDVEVVHVEWRPPAGGNEKLAAILEKMR